MKRNWWKVPLYCLIASRICFQLEVRLLLRFAIVTMPDGSISSDSTRSLIVFAFVFVAVLLIGGLAFFRKISRRELLVSALVMVALNVVATLIAYKVQGMFALYWSEFTEWSIFIPQLLYKLGMEPDNLLAGVLRWLAPLLFVPFGKKE